MADLLLCRFSVAQLVAAGADVRWEEAAPPDGSEPRAGDFPHVYGAPSGLPADAAGTPRAVVHVSRLRSLLRPGDLVLFRSANSLSGLQRTFTRAEYDHCAIVVDAPAPSPARSSSPFIACMASPAEPDVPVGEVKPVEEDSSIFGSFFSSNSSCG